MKWVPFSVDWTLSGYERSVCAQRFRLTCKYLVLNRRRIVTSRKTAKEMRQYKQQFPATWIWADLKRIYRTEGRCRKDKNIIYTLNHTILFLAHFLPVTGSPHDAINCKMFCPQTSCTVQHKLNSETHTEHSHAVLSIGLQDTQIFNKSGLNMEPTPCYREPIIWRIKIGFESPHFSCQSLSLIFPKRSLTEKFTTKKPYILPIYNTHATISVSLSLRNWTI
jgi:hypothetical protein